ncbi:hypothetical protein [Tabrizicola sp.]|uniref:hypothetical protein n=1 Tax=Tabrizicola sp. TaxID=2005166 RepID=UPI00286C77B7|nr:hypothetical protein [Tabrizicola sp.]
MQVIPDTVSRAHSDTDIQLQTVKGLLFALDEIIPECEGLNTPDPRSSAIFSLIEVVKVQAAKVRESHDAEWRAWHAPKLKVAE